MNTSLREIEIKTLQKLKKSNRSEFLAIYGRRRVGKTFLVRQQFSTENNYFELTGLKDGKLNEQLRNFSTAFGQTFYDGLNIAPPKSWHQAFTMLNDEMKKKHGSEKIILFFDELPWLASKRSKFLQELDYFWNAFWSKFNNIILIVCGSAASWMLNNIVKAKGGLHNRITDSLLIKPFNLQQTRLYLANNAINLPMKQIVELYMVMGGIPYYLNKVQKGRSVSQIINTLCFSEQAFLFREFDILFQSLFDKAEINLQIVNAIATKHYGVSRSELLKKLKLKSGSVINDRLNELIEAGFVQSFIPLEKSKKGLYYRIIDEYTLFYLQWIAPLKKQHRLIVANNHWQKVCKTPQWESWAGYAFEQVCLKHIEAIAKKLAIESIIWYAGNWRSYKTTPGAQIDLLFDRDDDVITLCEIKYSNQEFTIDKNYARNLAQKIQVFQDNYQTKKHIQIALITTYGLKTNIWSEELIDDVVILEDLFQV